MPIKSEQPSTCCIQHQSIQIPTSSIRASSIQIPVQQGATEEGDDGDSSQDVSNVIARANAGIRTRLIHDDIAPNLRRNAVPCTATGCKWPKRGRYVTVPYTIASHYSTTERNFIIRTLHSFHQATCIRFQPRTSHRDYIYFYSGSGCWSYLGRQGGRQYVSLRRNGCLYTSTVQHEVLHALGFHHEQVRSDRDRYIRILTQNIQSGMQHNFNKVQTNNLGTPYDFDSVMHYSKYAFSRNGQPTIVARSNPNLNFGGAKTLSPNDIARVNRLYKCCF
ncbi:hatching enzyme 1.2-like [Scomber japonicus]|uniref:hatching enzyme 1.2-like n=1 Tax=Scomber japonicus TaxID=13676 RepID=UPI002306A706|nr:hatching enzyme 1.2-like [Scomber japonicus]